MAFPPEVHAPDCPTCVASKLCPDVSTKAAARQSTHRVGCNAEHRLLKRPQSSPHDNFPSSVSHLADSSQPLRFHSSPLPSPGEPAELERISTQIQREPLLASLAGRLTVPLSSCAPIKQLPALRREFPEPLPEPIQRPGANTHRNSKNASTLPSRWHFSGSPST